MTAECAPPPTDPDWRPDWDDPNIIEDVHLEGTYEDKPWVTAFPVSVAKLGNGYYRLLDHPMSEERLRPGAMYFCDPYETDFLRWGDLIKAEEELGTWLRVVEVVEHAPHIDSDGAIIAGKRHAGLILDALMEAGGFWVHDEWCGFHAFVPPGFDIAAWERDNDELIKADELPETAFSAFTKQLRERRNAAREQHRRFSEEVARSLKRLKVKQDKKT